MCREKIFKISTERERKENRFPQEILKELLDKLEQHFWKIEYWTIWNISERLKTQKRLSKGEWPIISKAPER